VFDRLRERAMSGKGIQSIAYAVLLIVMFGVCVGWLGGL